jgi:hypothetical protein
MLPTAVRAEWLRDEGPFTYAEGAVSCGDVAWNLTPAEL